MAITSGGVTGAPLVRCIYGAYATISVAIAPSAIGMTGAL